MPVRGGLPWSNAKPVRARISRRWRGRADRGRIAGRSIDMRRVAVAVRDLLPACVPVRHAVAARSPRAARHAARWRVVGFSSRAVAADARSDWSRSRCRPLSRDQHETSSSHRDRDRVPRITATDDSAYDSARPPLSLRGCPQRRREDAWCTADRSNAWCTADRSPKVCHLPTAGWSPPSSTPAPR
jgi:hypothetical protein